MNHTFNRDENLPDVLLIHTTGYNDDRGFLLEVYNDQIFSQYDIPKIVQEKCSFSHYGVLRGLHFQKDPYAQGKIVRCSMGSVFDIAVDIRRDSPTFGKWTGHILSDINHKMMYVPPGFAHGVLSLSKNGSLFNYLITNQFSKDHEAGILWSDPKLNIQLPIPISDLILSNKDKELPNLDSI